MPGANVSVIVVCHNSGATLCRCVESILAQNIGLELILVDNASQDGSLDTLPASSRIRLWLNAGNVGFARACNQGVSIARGETLLFLNPDCFLPERALQTLCNRLAAQPKATILGAALCNADGTPQRSARRRTPTPGRALVRALGLERRLRLQGIDDVSAQEVADESVEAISGALMLMPRPLFDALGGFDEGYVLHCEDLDFCRRAYEAGYPMAVAEDVRVTHLKGTSSREHPFWVEWQKHRGMWRYFRKFDAGKIPRPLWLLLWVGLWGHFIFAVLRRSLVSARA